MQFLFYSKEKRKGEGNSVKTAVVFNKLTSVPDLIELVLMIKCRRCELRRSCHVCKEVSEVTRLGACQRGRVTRYSNESSRFGKKIYTAGPRSRKSDAKCASYDSAHNAHTVMFWNSFFCILLVGRSIFFISCPYAVQSKCRKATERL